MANLYRPTYTDIDPETGEPTKRKSKKWYGRFRNEHGVVRRVALATDKRVAQTMLNDILLKIEQKKAGLIDPRDEESIRPIEEHLTAFEKHLLQKGSGKRHIRDTLRKVQRLHQDRGWPRVRDIQATDIQAYLLDLKDQGLSTETRNHHLRAIKSFTRWLYRNRRIKDDPLMHLSMQNSKMDQRRVRRPLSDEEFDLLIQAAETGPPIDAISGPDRAMMYFLAAWTGLRKGEIGSLTLDSFDLDAEVPTVTVEAAYSKRRRRDVQVLHAVLVERFRKWLANRKSTECEILFPVSRLTGAERKTAKMMREDLAAARRKWLAEDETERHGKSDFLKYIDSQGRYADFHSNRHTFITNLSLAGVSPRDAQELARHSDIRLTMNIYTHVGLKEKAKAIGKLGVVRD